MCSRETICGIVRRQCWRAKLCESALWTRGDHAYDVRIRGVEREGQMDRIRGESKLE
jgi:hypothetical protein